MNNESKNILDQSESNNPSKMSNKKRKRGQGEGTIYKRKDGRWTAVVNLGYQNGKLKRKSYYGESRKEVSDKLSAALSDIQKGIPIITEHQTVGQFLDSWLSDCVKASVRPRSFVCYSDQVRLHIKPKIGHIPLPKLTPQQVQTFLNQQLETGLSARSVQYSLAVLKIALRQACKWGFVSRNVATLVEAPRAEKHEVRPMTLEEAQDFLKAIKGNRLEALFTVALSLGLRLGEATGLRWQDVDLDNRVLKVNLSLQRIDGKLRLTELKTKSSRRVLDLPLSLVTKLKEHRQRQLQERLLAGSHWHDTGLVFSTTLGTPNDPSFVRKCLKRILKDSGITHFRVHDLRHFCASLLLAQGVELKVVSEILGHAQISITADLYVHILPALKKDAAERMDAILAGVK